MARIAYIASDVVLSVQPALGTDSEFSLYLHGLAANGALGLVARGIPEVRRLREGPCGIYKCSHRDVGKSHPT